ncbi:MAG: 2Fe-2S iron-sulfur cluster-binding protein [Acidobacteriota bacterium]
METIKLEIDGKRVETAKGTTILDAARKAGIDIPTICHDKRLAPYGACRLCLVEIDKNGRKRLVASCAYQAEEGLVVRTETEKIIKIRRMILELLLAVSSTGPLETMAKRYGLEKSRFEGDQPKCLLCGLCVRYCAEVKKENVTCFIGRGIDREVVFLSDLSHSACPTCRECLPLCPSGTLYSLYLKGFSGGPETGSNKGA